MTVSVRKFEDQVWETEHVRIAIHANSKAQVQPYKYKNAADERWRITELSEKRIDKCLGNYSYSTIQGDGEEPHGRVILRTIKSSYGK